MEETGVQGGGRVGGEGGGDHDLFSAWNTSVGGRADSAAACLVRSLHRSSLSLWGCLSGTLLLFAAAAAEKTRGLTFLLLTCKDPSQMRGEMHQNFSKCSLLGILCWLYTTFSVVIRLYFELTSSHRVYSLEQWYFGMCLQCKMIRLN